MRMTAFSEITRMVLSKCWSHPLTRCVCLILLSVLFMVLLWSYEGNKTTTKWETGQIKMLVEKHDLHVINVTSPDFLVWNSATKPNSGVFYMRLVSGKYYFRARFIGHAIFQLVPEKVNCYHWSRRLDLSIECEGFDLFVLPYQFYDRGTFDFSIIANTFENRWADEISDPSHCIVEKEIIANSTKWTIIDINAEERYPSHQRPAIVWRFNRSMRSLTLPQSTSKFMDRVPRPTEFYFPRLDPLRTVNKTCVLRELTSSRTKICFVGDSHTRHLYNTVVSAFENKTYPLMHDVLSSNLSVQYPSFAKFARDIISISKTLTYCSHVVVNFGQWPWGFPGVRKGVRLLTMEAYVKDVMAVLEKLSAVVSNITWVTIEPCPDWRVFACPAGDFRHPSYLNRINNATIHRIQEKFPNVQVLDNFKILEPVLELAFDTCHYNFPYNQPNMELLWMSLYPSCVSRRVEAK